MFGRCFLGPCYSGITTLQAISEGIAKLTGPKLGQQLLKVFEPIVKPPIESMSKLEASYKQHCDSIALLQGIDITAITRSRTWQTSRSLHSQRARVWMAG